MASDPLSEILRLTEAKSVVAGVFEAGGTWALRFPRPGGPKFLAITKGFAWLRLDSHRKAVKFEPGDVCLLSGRDGFLAGTDLTVPPRDAPALFSNRVGLVTRLGSGADCLVLAGGVLLQPSSAAILMDVLPGLIHVRAAAPESAALRWIVEQIIAERRSTLPGADVASAQLAQLLFVRTLRAHLTSAGTLPRGWLRAVRDERLLRALRLMHGEPARGWRLEELAKAAAMSRTSFAVHFKATVGVAPLAYLTEWRMRLAQRALRDEDAAIAAIADTLGYASESAFSQAFKRVTGQRPRDFRHAARLNDRDSIADAYTF